MTRAIKIFAIALWVVFAFDATGQTYEPAILILSPKETTADTELKKEISEVSDLIEKNQKQKGKDLKHALNEIEDRPDNIKLMYQKKN